MNKKNILVIDDEEINHFIAQRILQSIEWINRIDSARTGAQAIQLLMQQCRKWQHNTDLILLDLHMPEMNGLEFLHALRSLDSLGCKLDKMIIAILSSSENADDQLQAMELGAHYFIRKPLSVEKMMFFAKHVSYEENR